MKAIIGDFRSSADDGGRPTLAKYDLLIRTSVAGDGMSSKPLAVPVRSARSAPPGSAFTGVVVAVGAAVSGFTRGDRVCGISRETIMHGALTVLPEVEAQQLVVKLPSTVDDQAAISLPMAGLTASACVNRIDEYHEQFILVVGITGPIGQFTSQLATMRGAVVIGVGEGATLTQRGHSGATALVDLHRSDPSIAAGEVWKRFGNNFDVVIDVTGDAGHAREFGRLVRPGGRYLAIDSSLTSDTLHDLDVRPTIITFDEGLAGLQDELERLVGFVAAKKLRVPEVAAKSVIATIVSSVP